MKNNGFYRYLFASGMTVLSVVVTVAIYLAIPSKKPQEKYVPLIQEALPKTVIVYVETVIPVTQLIWDENGIRTETSTATVKSSGSGAYISPQGHVLTAGHMWFGEVKRFSFCNYYKKCRDAEPLYLDPDSDLLLVKSTDTMTVPYFKLAKETEITVGQEVIAIGNPLSLSYTATHGIISRFESGFVQSDTFINPGNSGGPLINMQGELVGIVSRLMAPVKAPVFTGLGFHVDVRSIHKMLNKFKGLVEN